MEEIKLHQFAEKLELAGYSKRCIADYPAQVRLFFTYLEKYEEEIHTIKDISIEHITAYHCWLQCTKLKKGEYLSSVTVRSRLGAVKTFYVLMHRERLVECNLAPLIHIPKRKSSLPRNVPSEKDMQNLLNAIEPVDNITTRDKAMLELLYATGMRNEEIRTATVDMLDIQQRTLLITGKGSKDRIVPVGDWVIPYLVEYIEASRQKLLNQKQTTNLLFISKNGRRISNGNLGDIIRKYTKKAEIGLAITPHSFRHACATHLLRAGADIRYVQELLGHADLSSTQIYTKIDISFLKKAHQKYHPREKELDKDDEQ